MNIHTRASWINGPDKWMLFWCQSLRTSSMTSRRDSNRYNHHLLWTWLFHLMLLEWLKAFLIKQVLLLKYFNYIFLSSDGLPRYCRPFKRSCPGEHFVFFFVLYFVVYHLMILILTFLGRVPFICRPDQINR